MSSIGELIQILEQTKHSTAAVSIQYWRESVPPEKWETYLVRPFTPGAIISLRRQMSNFYADHLNSISGEEYYEQIRQEHIDFIQEFDSAVQELFGYIVTEPRACICFSEAMQRNKQEQGSQT